MVFVDFWGVSLSIYLWIFKIKIEARRKICQVVSTSGEKKFCKNQSKALCSVTDCNRIVCTFHKVRICYDCKNHTVNTSTSQNIENICQKNGLIPNPSDNFTLIDDTATVIVKENYDDSDADETIEIINSSSVCGSLNNLFAWILTDIYQFWIRKYIKTLAKVSTN